LTKGKQLQIKPLLVIEDDPGLQKQMTWCFEGYTVHVAGTMDEALAALRRYAPPVITLDLGLPPDPANVSVGLQLLEEIISLKPETKVIVVTGNDDRDNAVKAIAMGAYDFYQKPIDADILKIIVDRAYQMFQLEEENRLLSQAQSHSPLDGIIAISPQMGKICRTIEKVAPSDVSILLLGESGTGKEVLARAVHDLSQRSGGPFIAINCAAIPENLLESELFGYEKGAFTGASKQTAGKFEYANGGTLFLDEIGDLPLPLQAKLLRFLQERVIERVGGRKEIPIDVRVVCATHRDLKNMISEEVFREDLFYRLSEIVVSIPPLREREGDAILLAKTFLEKFSRANDKKIKGFTKKSLSALKLYPWPGNVRELENKVKRAVIMAEGAFIEADELDLEEIEGAELPFNLREVRNMAETDAIKRALSYADGNIAKSAELLGVSRPTLYDLMNKLNIKE